MDHIFNLVYKVLVSVMELIGLIASRGGGDGGVALPPS